MIPHDNFEFSSPKIWNYKSAAPGSFSSETNFFVWMALGRLFVVSVLLQKQAKSKERNLNFHNHQNLLKLVHYSESYKDFCIKPS